MNQKMINLQMPIYVPVSHVLAYYLKTETHKKFFRKRRFCSASLSPLRFSQLVQASEQDIPPATSQDIM